VATQLRYCHIKHFVFMHSVVAQMIVFWERTGATAITAGNWSQKQVHVSHTGITKRINHTDWFHVCTVCNLTCRTGLIVDSRSFCFSTALDHNPQRRSTDKQYEYGYSYEQFSTPAFGFWRLGSYCRSVRNYT